MPKIIDLHVHSNFSDGQFSPLELIELAKKNNVSHLSITDHDDIRSALVLAKEDLGINYINGVELSTTTNLDGRDLRIHMLGYGYDEQNKMLNDIIENKKILRREINTKYLKELQNQFSFINDSIYETVNTGRYISLYRIILKYLDDNNTSLEQIASIKKYIKENGVTYPNYDFKDKEAINLLLDANGLPVLAHPYQYKLTYDEEITLIERLKKFGLIGIEAYHSGDTFDNMQTQMSIAKKYNLDWTVGSDFHTDYDDDDNMIGYGKSNNLCKSDCSLIRRLHRK